MIFGLNDLRAIAEQFKAPFAVKLRMNHAEYELIRDEVPVAKPSPFLPSSLSGLAIEVDNDIPPGRIVVIDQYGHLLDVVTARLRTTERSEPARDEQDESDDGEDNEDGDKHD